MKVPVSVHIMLGDDTQDTLDTEILVTVDPDEIVLAIVRDSRGLAPMHIIEATNNYSQFIKAIPQEQIDLLTLGQRRIIAGWFRTTAKRFCPEETKP